MNGYFTVEAAMVFPVFLIVCVFLVYLGLYQYNRCLAQQSLYYTLVREKELSYASQNELEEIISHMFEETMDKQYFMALNGNISCKMEYGKLILEYMGEMHTPWLNIDSGIEGKQWKLQIHGEKQRWRPVDFIRLCARVKGEQ